MSHFLSGENTNYVVQQIIAGLNKYSVDLDIRTLQGKIINFMARVEKEYPNKDIKSMNQFVVNQCIEKYLNQQNVGGQSKDKINNEYERELMSRGYSRNTAPPVPPQPDFTQPINRQGETTPSINGTTMTLSQAQGHQPMNIAPVLESPPPAQQLRATKHHNIEYENKDEISNNQTLVIDNMNKIYLSLNKDDLINCHGNRYTFSWNRKIVSQFKDHFSIKIDYVTLPKKLPYLLVKYPEDKNNHVYSGLGNNYSAKLIPSHTSSEYTTYRSLDHAPMVLDYLPHTLAFEFISPIDELDLNSIKVSKVTKNQSQISITTKKPHNLGVNDNLILEFKKNK